MTMIKCSKHSEVLFYRVGHKFPYIGECTMYIFWYLDYQFPEAWIGRRGLPDPPISHPLISIFGGT